MRLALPSVAFDADGQPAPDPEAALAALDYSRPRKAHHHYLDACHLRLLRAALKAKEAELLTELPPQALDGRPVFRVGSFALVQLEPMFDPEAV